MVCHVTKGKQVLKVWDTQGPGSSPRSASQSWRACSAGQSFSGVPHLCHCHFRLCSSQRWGHKVPAEGSSLTQDNFLPVWVQESSFLCSCQRSTSTRAQAVSLTCTASDPQGCLLTVMQTICTLVITRNLGFFHTHTISQERSVVIWGPG